MGRVGEVSIIWTFRMSGNVPCSGEHIGRWWVHTQQGQKAENRVTGLHHELGQEKCSPGVTVHPARS